MGTLGVDDDCAGFARHRECVAFKGDSDGRGPGGVLHIIVIFLDILVVDNGLGRLLQGAVIQLDLLGDDFFYRWLYWTTAQDDIDDGIHVADVDLAVAVHIASGVIIAPKDDVDDSVHVADVDLVIAVHVACHRRHRQDRYHGQ